MLISDCESVLISDCESVLISDCDYVLPAVMKNVTRNRAQLTSYTVSPDTPNAGANVCFYTISLAFSYAVADMLNSDFDNK